MKLRLPAGARSSFPVLLTVAMATAVVVLTGYGYRAVREWRRSAALLVDRRVESGADLLVSALRRDMHGAQSLVLANRDSGDYATQSLAEFETHVAAAFTRYPYPESFVGWHRSDNDAVLFNRASRPPHWVQSVPSAGRYPVAVSRNLAEGRQIVDRILADAALHVAYSHFEMNLDGVPYEIVARLQYSDIYQEQIESVTGFTVNLLWVREHYFSEMIAAVSRIADSGTALDYSVLDESGGLIAGNIRNTRAAVREFPFQFFDPQMSEVRGDEDAPRIWQVRVAAAADPTLVWATSGVDWTLLAIGATALGLAISLVLTAHLVRAHTSLAAMRAEFVSIVTHELKTPLATIRVAAETMVRGQLTEEGATDYAHLLARESRRLARLVDNLLAYARIVDLKDLYTFECLAPAELIEDSLRGFERQFSERRFEVTTDVPHDLPLIRGDRTALRLALDNLIDNAIRYSGDTRSIEIAARKSGSRIVIEVRDRGMGIAPDEIQLVKQRFVRGRRANTHGTGLGLGIVMRVVGDHGGHFDLEGALGLGTTARLNLPIP